MTVRFMNDFLQYLPVKRFVHEFGEWLGGQSFSDTGRAVQQKDATAPLAADNVREGPVLELDQRGDQFLLFSGQDELVEGSVVELDFVQLTHRNFTPLFGHKREAVQIRVRHPQVIVGQPKNKLRSVRHIKKTRSIFRKLILMFNFFKYDPK